MIIYYIILNMFMYTLLYIISYYIKEYVCVYTHCYAIQHNPLGTCNCPVVFVKSTGSLLSPLIPMTLISPLLHPSRHSHYRIMIVEWNSVIG